MKKGLLVFVFVILLLPYLQHRLQLVTSGPLHGYYTNSPDVDFTLKGWFDGTYQAGINSFYNDHIGFREDMIRLNGQIDFSLFKKLDYGGTTLGDDNYLFYTNYIDAYYGRDFGGYDILYERMRKLKCIQDTLERAGKSLVVMYAPCKVWYYSEYIPYLARVAMTGQNNYRVVSRIGDSLGINQMDLNSWFLSMKDTTKELLYSRQGIHWTNYGAVLAWDSLVGYVEQLRNIRMPHPMWTKVKHSTEPWAPDNDMSDILNLIYPIATETFGYQEIFYPEDTTLAKPTCILVGDSYVINLFRTSVIQNTTTGSQFWFYFKSVLHDTDANTASEFPQIAEYDWRSELQKTDCVLFVYTPMNTFYLGNGFIEEAYSYYFPGR